MWPKPRGYQLTPSNLDSRAFFIASCEITRSNEGVLNNSNCKTITGYLTGCVAIPMTAIYQYYPNLP